MSYSDNLCSLNFSFLVKSRGMLSFDVLNLHVAF